MNKEELITLLKQYKENKAKLNIKLKELKTERIKLKYVNDTETTMTATYGTNQDIHSKNQISDKVSRRIEENDNKRLEIEKRIETLEEEVRKLREKVESVDDRLIGLKYKERELLTAYYIDGRTAQNIGDKLYFQMYNRTCSARYIQKIIDKATRKMINI